ncbi:unnamed protein product [Tuber melanosporum]|uniref:(Perigord truffle) hypothetical protein n=1 Tax=Tuber melanosporum (strain Mel28) TaxID=656061 RepID=D5GGL0_TUBMM|nr:uncharacterized protein GSTUM_00007543001 [Tuber melanosporum]CAZ83740.1 unnamed protein product [Tuber melanosporum]
MTHYLQRSTRKSDLPIPLDYRVIDVLLELCRKGELKELQELLFTLANEAPPSVLPLDLLTASKGKESLNNTLHMASANGHYEVARYLLTLLPRPTPTNPNPHKPHAFPTVTNNAGHNVLFEAQSANKEDVAKFLLETCPELAAPIGRTEEVVMEGEGEGEGEGGAAEKGKGKETEGVTGGMGELEISAGDTKTNKAGNA